MEELGYPVHRTSWRAWSFKDSSSGLQRLWQTVLEDFPQALTWGIRWHVSLRRSVQNNVNLVWTSTVAPYWCSVFSNWVCQSNWWCVQDASHPVPASLLRRFTRESVLAATALMCWWNVRLRSSVMPRYFGVRTWGNFAPFRVMLSSLLAQRFARWKQSWSSWICWVSGAIGGSIGLQWWGLSGA